MGRLMRIPCRHRCALGRPTKAKAQLYVSHPFAFNGNGFISKYDAKTGEVIRRRFIEGLREPVGLAVKGNTLFVLHSSASTTGSTVGEYDADSGAAIKADFISETFLYGLAVKR